MQLLAAGSLLSFGARPHNATMHMLKHLSILLTLVLAPLAVTAEPMPAAAKAEVTAAFARLEASGCKFNRNGKWYTGTQAREHLQKKLDYAEKKTSLKTAEEFIAVAASKSSTTGEPYQVKCADKPPVLSSVWLQRQVQAGRALK